MHLRQVFERCREHCLKMNPSKCAFGVSSRKFLGFLVHHRGINLDPTKAKAMTTLNPPITLKELRSFVQFGPSKAKAMTTLNPPTTLKELRSFVGKVSYLRRRSHEVSVDMPLVIRKNGVMGHPDIMLRYRMHMANRH